MQINMFGKLLKLGGAMAVGLGMLWSGGAAAEISGSVHDLSGKGYARNTGNELCVFCHTPHWSDTSVNNVPLWNHDLTQQVFLPYSSPTLNATPGAPDGVSKLCLSCHDGTVALDAFGNTAPGGTPGTPTPGPGNTITGIYAVGNDGVANDHPISFDYTDALAAADGALAPPSSTNVTIGSGSRTKAGTIATVMLYAGKVECASCHDVHNDFVDGTGLASGTNRLLKITKASSALCLTCHTK